MARRESAPPTTAARPENARSARPARPAWTWLAAIAGVAAVTVGLQLWLGQIVDARYAAILALRGLEAQLNHQSAIEWEAAATRRVEPEVLVTVDRLKGATASQVAALARLPVRAQTLDKVRQLLEQYQDATNRELQLFQVGDSVAALGVDRAEVDPAFDALHEALEAAIEEHNVIAARANLSRVVLGIGLVLGALAAVAFFQRRFDQVRTSAAQLSAEQAANERLRQALAEVTERQATITRQAEWLRVLDDFARMVTTTLDLESIVQVMTEAVPPVLECQWCSIAHYNPASDKFLMLARSGGEGGRRGTRFGVGATIPAQGSALGVALRTRQPCVVQDLATSPLSLSRHQSPGGAGETWSRHRTGSLVVAPILIEDQVWGACIVGFEVPDAATPERVTFLAGLASHLTIAIKNAQLYAELRAAQEQASQQERLRALGQMASGIAHDLNNALSPVVAFTELLRLRPDFQADEQARQYLDFIHSGAQDAASVVRRLREFYRPRERGEALLPVDLAAVAKQAVALTRPKWRDQAQAQGRTVVVETELQAVPPVQGDEAQLREALTNLLFNAVDALPDGGRVTIRTQTDGSWSVLEVSDTGIGMTAEIQRRCLEPFFTTKGMEGTGIGLAMVHGIVQRHGGTLAIESEPGAGTTVTISLPQLQDTRPAVRGAGVPAGPSATAQVPSQRILVVDDEPAIRDLLRAYLVRDGHSVATASNGREALRAFQDSPYDLVVTDRAMPELNGDELAAAIKQVAPATPIVMLTGFGDLMAAANERPAGVDAITGKPPTAATLRQAVTSALANTAGQSA